MQTQIHTTSLFMALGFLPVPSYWYQKKEPRQKPRYMTKDERESLVPNIVKHIEILGKNATAEFIYYEMLDEGEIPILNRFPLVRLDTFLNYYKCANRYIAGNTVTEKKICQECGAEYERKMTIATNAWKKSKYCTRHCASVVTARKRLAK